MSDSRESKDGQLPERQAAWVDGVCKSCGQYTHSCKCAHPPSPLLDMLRAMTLKCRFYRGQDCSCNHAALSPSDCT